MPNPTESASDFDRTAHENRTPAGNRETVDDPFRFSVPETAGKSPLTVSKGAWARGFTIQRTLSEAAGGKSLNENSPKGTNTPEETAELSGGYLDRAYLVSDRLGNREAEKSIEKKLDYVKAREKYSPLWTFSGSEGGIKEKEAALKKEAAAFGCDGRRIRQCGIVVIGGRLGRYGGVDFLIRRGEQSRRYIKSGTGYVLAQGAKSAVAVAVRSNEEDSKIAAYTDIKHSLPALKLLKRSVSAERKEKKSRRLIFCLTRVNRPERKENRFFPRRYGNARARRRGNENSAETCEKALFMKSIFYFV